MTDDLWVLFQLQIQADSNKQHGKKRTVRYPI